MSDEKISVIIPVYNAENYIEKAINSCLNQTIDSLEIICINDGSTDNSKVILEKYEKQRKIRLINKENEGTGSARNDGIRMAKGEFLAFLDADDCYPNAFVLQKLYDCAVENGVNICGGDAVIERNGVLLDIDESHPSYRLQLCRKYGFCNYLEEQFYAGFTRFIYNREMIINNNILFPSITEFEDPIFLVKAFYCSRYYYAIHEHVYQIHRGDHIRTYNSHKKVEEFLIGITEVLRFSKEKKLAKLQAGVLDETYRTKYNIFMYPYLNENIALMDLARSAISYIDEKLLLEENKGEYFEKFQEERIIEEIRDTKLEMEKFNKVLADIDEVYIYGAGILAERVYRYLKKYSVSVKAYLVSSMEGNPKEVHGIKVTTLGDELLSLDVPIVVALVSTKEVTKILRKHGFKEVIDINFSKMRLFL